MKDNEGFRDRNNGSTKDVGCQTIDPRLAHKGSQDKPQNESRKILENTPLELNLKKPQTAIFKYRNKTPIGQHNYNESILNTKPEDENRSIKTSISRKLMSLNVQNQQRQ
jgi:hypothetical protein